MASTRPTTDLDFDQIKSDMINFIKTNPAYTDYNFEGSALNALIDILSYNTHNNAYYANMVHGEGFLDTAQKRSSVVSRAKELGYVPRSAVCSTAYINIVSDDVSIDTPAFILPRGTTFASSNDNGAHSFVTVNDQLSTITAGKHRFTNVRLVAGIMAQNTFKVDTSTNVRSIFTIPNKNIDTSTLTVFVRDSANSVERTEYFLAEDVYVLRADSRKYFIQESYGGEFQIFFGGDVLGNQPVNGNIIDVEYVVSTSLGDSDLCGNFTANGSIGSSTSFTVSTTQISYGGKDKETIESIKSNALKSNTSKERVVTESDYELSINEKFSFIKSVSVWGGEKNVPPVYGKVFVSVQPVNGFLLSESVKRDVLMPALKASSVMTITPEIVDPAYTILNFVTRIKFNPHKTMTTTSGVSFLVMGAVSNYIDSISAFNSDYHNSPLLSAITNVDPGIVSVNLNKTIGFKLTPIVGMEVQHTNTVNNPIDVSTITSSKFNVFYGSLETVTIHVIPNKMETKINFSGVSENIYYLGLYTSSNVLVREIGYVNSSTGKFDIAFSLYSYLTDNRFINITMSTIDTDILVSRNQILLLDDSVIDYTANMVDNNKVIVDIYDK
jgi:hypothetical protein